MSLDRFLSRRYSRAARYDCFAFAAEVWRALTGDDLITLIGCSVVPSAMQMRAFERLPSPVSPCLVLLRSRNVAHIGVYLNGRVLHLCGRGVEYQPIDVVSCGFKRVRFYR